jgi:hypothetical protein
LNAQVQKAQTTALASGRHTNTAIFPVDVTKTQTPVDVLAGVLRRDWADIPARAQAQEIRQRQTVEVPATSVLRDPVTAAKQTATMQPVERPPVEAKTLEPEHLRRFLEEQRTLTAEVRMLPNRVGDAARQVDRLTPKVQQLEQTAKGHRGLIAEQQKLLDGHKTVACSIVPGTAKPWNASKHQSSTNNKNSPSFKRTFPVSPQHYTCTHQCCVHPNDSPKSVRLLIKIVKRV